MGAREKDLFKAHVLHTKCSAQEKKMKAPKDLDKESKALWKSIVDAYPASHFRPGDDALLKRYCEAATTADREAAILEEEGNIIGTEKDSKINPRRLLVNMLTNTMAQAATKLRICPSTRLKRTVTDQQGTLELDEKKNARAGIMFGS